MIRNYESGTWDSPYNLRTPKATCSGTLVYRLLWPHCGAGGRDLKGDTACLELGYSEIVSVTSLSYSKSLRQNWDGGTGDKGYETEEEWGRFIPKRGYFLKQGSAGFFKDIDINYFRLCGFRGHFSKYLVCSMDNQEAWLCVNKTLFIHTSSQPTAQRKAQRRPALTGLQPKGCRWLSSYGTASGVIQSVCGVITSTDLPMATPWHLQFASYSMVPFPMGLLCLLINRNAAYKWVTAVSSLQKPFHGCKPAKFWFIASVVKWCFLMTSVHSEKVTCAGDTQRVCGENEWLFSINHFRAMRHKSHSLTVL